MSDEWPPKPFTAGEIEELRRSWTENRTWSASNSHVMSKSQFEKLLAIATIYSKPLLLDGITLADVERLRHLDVGWDRDISVTQSQELKARVCDAAAARIKLASDWRIAIVDALQEASSSRDHVALQMLSEQLGGESMLVLSTAHVPKNTAGILEMLAHEPSSDVHTWAPRFARAQGWIFHVGDKAGADILQAPDGLALVLTHARVRHFPWLMLDCDGPVVDDLPKYEW